MLFKLYRKNTTPNINYSHQGLKAGHTPFLKVENDVKQTIKSVQSNNTDDIMCMCKTCPTSNHHIFTHFMTCNYIAM